MNKNYFKSAARILIPVIIVCIVCYFLPVRTMIKLLFIPFLPILAVLNIAFLLLPLALLVLVGLLFGFLYKLTKAQGKIFLIKTKYILCISLIIVVLGYTNSILTTSLCAADIPTIGLSLEE